MDVLDLFSAAAGGWSLGLHRAGFRTIVACEAVAWRRALYAENNPGVVIYDDVCTLTANRVVSDLGYFPQVVVGSPPCQDISSANTKGKGVDGERSGLFFEAVRIIGEGRPRWFALENSANLRTRGADAVLTALEALGYACWPFVVGAGDVGANHERKRSWLIGCDVDQVADADGIRRDAGWEGRRSRIDLSVSHDPFDASCIGHESGRARGRRPDGDGAASVATGARKAPHAHQARQAHGCVVTSLRQTQEPDHGRSDVGSADVADTDREGQSDGAFDAEVGWDPGLGDNVAEPWADWNGGLADHLRVDDGLSAWVAGTRIAIGGPRGTSAASLIVEAFGDSVVPQIPEAIGRAILRTEAALSAVFRPSPSMGGQTQ